MGLSGIDEVDWKNWKKEEQPNKSIHQSTQPIKDIWLELLMIDWIWFDVWIEKLL